MGVFIAYKIDELVKMTIQDIEDEDSIQISGWNCIKILT